MESDSVWSSFCIVDMNFAYANELASNNPTDFGNATGISESSSNVNGEQSGLDMAFSVGVQELSALLSLTS